MLCVIGVSSMFGGMISLGTRTVSGATGRHGLREMVVVDDLVVMMDMVVNLEFILWRMHFLIW